MILHYLLRLLALRKMKTRKHLLTLLILVLPLCACGVDRPFYLRAWERDRLAAEKARTQHRLQAAERHAQDALAEAEHLGASDFRLAVSLYDLACIYVLREKYKLALPLVQRALDVLQKASSHSSALIDREIVQQERARSLLLLGDLDYRKKNYEKAFADYQDARKLLEQWCNPEHLESGNPLGIELVRSIWGQAECLFAQNNNALSEEHFLKALRLAEANAYPLAGELQERYSEFLQSQGRKDEDAAAADKWRQLSASGREFSKKKDWAAARRSFLGALDLAKSFRSDDVRLAATYKNIGDMSTRLGDRQMSELYFEKAYNVCSRMKQPLFALTDDLLQDVAAIKLVLGKFDQAEKFFRQELALREKYYGKGERTAEVMLQLSELEMYHGRKDKQHIYAIDAFNEMLKDHGSRRKTASTFQRLSASFIGVGDYARAQTCMDEAVKIWKDRLELRGERISSNLYRLAFLAALQNKNAEEKQYLAQARQLLKTSEPPEYLAIGRLLSRELQDTPRFKNTPRLVGKLHQWLDDLVKIAKSSEHASDADTARRLKQIENDADATGILKDRPKP